MECDCLDWSPRDSDLKPTKIEEILIDTNPDTEQLLDTDLDNEDQKYVRLHYRKGSKEGDCLITCANCFTPLSYQATFSNNNYYTKTAINVHVIESGWEDAETPLKRTRHRVFDVACDSCDEIVATLDNLGVYKFNQVIPSDLTPD